MGSLAIPTLRLQRYPDEAGRSWHKPLMRSTLAVDDVDPLERQMAHFVDVVQGRAQPLVSGRDGLQNLKVVEAIAEAGRTGRLVRLG